MTTSPKTAFLLVSFGGPEGPDDVMPFLNNVLRGKPVPEERKLEVAEHYYEFGGISPINAQNRKLIANLESAFQERGISIPIYWGNRNWAPTLPETLNRMKEDGVERVYAFFTSMFSCYSGCRQYRENIIDAREEVGDGAPEVLKLRMGFNHPDFIAAQNHVVFEALSQFDEGVTPTVLFTAHSIPMGMANNSHYEKQLRETMRLTAEQLGLKKFELVYQSRSGSPAHPWLEPDVCDRLHELAAEGLKHVVLVPLGFISDHMEVLFDLDTEAKEVCDEQNINMVRAKTVSDRPEFLSMVTDLLLERMEGRTLKLALGPLGPWHDVCPENCCMPGQRPMGRPTPSV